MGKTGIRGTRVMVIGVQWGVRGTGAGTTVGYADGVGRECLVLSLWRMTVGPTIASPRGGGEKRCKAFSRAARSPTPDRSVFLSCIER